MTQNPNASPPNRSGGPLQTSSRKRFPLLILGGVILAAGFALWWILESHVFFLKGTDPTTMQDSDKSAMVSDDQEPQVHPAGKPQQNGLTTLETAAAEGEGRGEAEPPPGSELWFVRPELSADLRFREAAPTPLDWDSGCSEHPFRRYTELGQLAKEAIAIDATDYFASQALPLQFAQFWSDGESYFQFGFKWEQNTPQTFSLEAYRSLDRTLSGEVTRYEIADFPHRDGVLFSEIRSYLKTTIAALSASQELTLGARIGLFRTYEPVGPGGAPEYFFTQLRNAQVISISGESLNCQKSDVGERALCTCPVKVRP